MSGTFPRFLLALSLAALAVGCGKKEEPAAVAVEKTSTPQGTVDAAVASLKAGDIKALIASQVPPKHFDELRGKWKEDMAKDPPDEAEKQEFATMIAELTEPGAEEKMMEKLEPQIVKFEAEMAPQMPMMVGMGKGLLVSSIQQNKDLTDPQKQDAAKSIDALANWVTTTNFTDRAKAKQAVAALVAAARELNLKTLDEARALDFDTAMDKSSIAFRGAKKVLDTYGFSIDKMLDTVKTEVVSQTGDQAKVKVSYQMFDQPMSFETDLVQIDGRWYGKQAIAELEKPDEPESEFAPEADGEPEIEAPAEPVAEPEPAAG